MKYRKISVIGFCLGLLGCMASGQDQDTVRSVVNLYVDGMLSHQFSDDYRTKYVDGIFHPDANPIGAHNRYTSIQEELPSYQHYNIVTSWDIRSINKSEEKVYAGQDTKNGEVTYFVKVHFRAVAIQKADGLVVLGTPVDIYEYIILGKDKSDGKYKIVDVYPEPNSRFLEIQYALEHLTLVARVSGTSNVVDLEKKLRAIKQ